MPCWLKNKLLLCSVLSVVVMFVFSGLLDSTFVIYDDPEYVTENVNIRSGLTWQGLQWAFTSFSNANWHPLTWLSHMLDIQLYGLNPTGHHLTSLLLHAANTLLLFIVLYRMSGTVWQSFATALLFGIHPLHVESVAWIAERKDVLSGFFFVASLWAYERHARQPGIGRYWLVVVLFALGLLAKPMLVTLPLVLLLLDYWPLNRVDGGRPASGVYPRCSPAAVLREKLPLVVLSVVSSVITYVAQLRGGATPYPDKSSHVENSANALFSYGLYVRKLLWPQDLAVFYPRGDIPIMLLVLASAVVVVLTVAAFLVRKKYPFVFVGWFWFIGTLLPVIGFIRIGSAAMSDRYTYIPAIGFFMALCWLVGAVPAMWPGKRLKAVIIVVIFGALSLLTVRQVRYWNNSFTLFEHALRVTDNNLVAHNNLASAYLMRANNDQSFTIARYLCSKNGCENSYDIRQDCLTKAIAASKAAIRINHEYAPPYFNLAAAYHGIGEWQAAWRVLDNLRYVDPVLAEQLERYLHVRQ